MSNGRAGAASRQDELIAKQAIRELKARYFRYMDMRDWRAMNDVFAEDAVMDMRSEMAELARAGLPVDPDGGMIIGGQTIVAAMSKALVGAVTVHHGHMPEIEILSDSEASGVWAMEDIIKLPKGAPAKILHGYGHYYETYFRGNDAQWRIKTLRLTRLLLDVS